MNKFLKWAAIISINIVLTVAILYLVDKTAESLAGKRGELKPDEALRKIESIKIRSGLSSKCTEGSYSPGTFRDFLFFNGAIHSEATYGIDDFSRRETPQDGSLNRKKHLILMGDSFVFGVGVNDNGTIPYYLARMKKGFKVYNYGISGFGAHQLLKRLKDCDVAAGVSEKEGILVYVLNHIQIERARMNAEHLLWFDANQPFYYLDSSGKLVGGKSYAQSNPIRNYIFGAIRQSAFLHLVRRDNYYSGKLRFSDRDLELASKIIAAIKSEYLRQFPKGRFIAYFMPFEWIDYAPGLSLLLEKSHVEYRDHSTRGTVEMAKKLELPDHHFSPAGNKLIAGYLGEAINGYE